MQDATESTGGIGFLTAPPTAELTSLVTDLIGRLGQGGYARIGVLPLPGKMVHLPLDVAGLRNALTGRSNLFQKSAVPWLYRAFSGGAAELFEAFFLCRELPLPRAAALLGSPLAERLLAAGILQPTGSGVRSRLMFVPHRGGTYCSDPLWLRHEPDYVYAGRSSLLADLILALEPRGFGGKRLLDLGCGSGIISLGLAPYFEQVLGVDIIDRCLWFAQLNAHVAGAATCEFRHSDLFDSVEGLFDVIVTNPPCGWIDPTIESAETFSTGGEAYGTDLPVRALSGSLQHLAPGGRIYSAVTAPVFGRKPFVADLLERALGGHAVLVTVYPLIEEWSYRRAALYRRHGVTRMVRYLVRAERAGSRFDLRYRSLDRVRLWSYRLRATLPRAVALLTGKGRPPARARAEH